MEVTFLGCPHQKEVDDMLDEVDSDPPTGLFLRVGPKNMLRTFRSRPSHRNPLFLALTPVWRDLKYTH